MPSTLPPIAASAASTLIRRFEDSIVFDCHSLRARFCRSQPAQELVRAGPFVLGEIATHLAAPRDPREYESYKNIATDLRTVWIWLLRSIADAFLIRDVPPDFADISDWAKWAENNAV